MPPILATADVPASGDNVQILDTPTQGRIAVDDNGKLIWSAVQLGMLAVSNGHSADAAYDHADAFFVAKESEPLLAFLDLDRIFTRR